MCRVQLFEWRHFQAMAESDSGYKLLFSHPELVADLLRGFVPELWVADVDFATLTPVKGSYVSDSLRQRH